MQQVNKAYYWLFAIGVTILVAITCFDFWLKVDPQGSIDDAFLALEDRYRRDSTLLVTKFLEEGQGVDDLDASPFRISVHDPMDSLIFWNYQAAKNLQSEDVHWRKRFKHGSVLVLFETELFDGNKLDLKPLIPKECLPPYSFVYTTNGPYTVPFSSQVSLAKADPFVRSNWHKYLVFFWSIGLLFVGMFSVNWISKLVSLSRYTILGLSILVIIGIGWLGGIIAMNHIFGSLDIAKPISNGISLLTFSSLLVLFYLSAYALDIYKIGKKLLTLPVVLRFLMSSILINGLLFFLILQSERFIYSSVIKINIDEVLNLHSDALYFIFVTIGFCLVYYYLSSIMYRGFDQSKSWQRIVGHGIGLVASALLFKSLGLMTPIIPVILFVLAYYLIFDIYEEFNSKNLTYVLTNLILFAGFLSVLIFYLALRQDKFERKKQIENTFYQLSKSEEATLFAARDSLISSNLIPSVSSLSFRSTMDRNELMTYVKAIIAKADPSGRFKVIGLEIYDQLGNSLFFNHISNIHNNNRTIINSDKIGTNVFHLPFGSVSSIFFQIENEEYIGTSPINMIIKLSNKDGLSDEIFEDRNLLVYKNNSLIYFFNKDYLDVNTLDPVAINEDVDIDDMSYVVYAPDSKYKVIDYHEVAGLIKPISFFSLIFILSCLLIVLLTLINSKINILPSALDFKFYNKTSLQSKIQLSVILLIIFSFVVIGVITTLYFNNIVTANDRSKFKTELRTIVNDVQNMITETVDSEAAANTIAQQFSEMENVYNRKLSYYNEHGTGIIKSDNYEGSFDLVPYSLLTKFSNTEEKTFKTVSQQITDNQVIIPIYINKSLPTGYITLNYTSDKSISSGIYNHLANLLNVYIFLFFVAGAISIYIAKSITNPLAKLREGVKRFKLGKTNEPLQYHSEDELGVLIKEYNNMTRQLEKSAEIIAKTERDLAWREMAKQVAHEIKNPLTPMKLHIQHLENTLKSDPDRAQEMIPKVATTLIEQINNLSNIAGEFSNYATLPNADNNRTDLNEVLEHVHDLFRERDDMDISMNEPIDDLYVFADRGHLVRIFVNIIKNAVQSIPQDRRGRIEIELLKVEGQARISITDNGAGIPEDMKDKIFTPNFTTKSSGTGLGLAICVNMLDSMNGKIYFDSKVDEGTTFYIEIPIMRNASVDDSDIYLDEVTD